MGEVHTFGIHVNVSDTGVDINFDVTLGRGASTASPLDEDDANILFGNDQENFTDFVFSPFTINVNSDDDDAPMSEGQFKTLNEKLDSLLESS